MKIMTFFLAGSAYAVDLSAVVAVARAEAAGESPAPVLDLARVLGVEAGAEEEGSVIVLRGEGGAQAKVRVERTGEVSEVGREGVQGVPRYFESALLHGVVAVGEGLAVLLDPVEVVRAAGTQAIAPGGSGAGEGDR